MNDDIVVATWETSDGKPTTWKVSADVFAKLRKLKQAAKQ